MGIQSHSLNFELPELSDELHFNKYAQQILENGKTSLEQVIAASTPSSISTLDTASTGESSSDFYKSLSTLLNSIQVQNFHKIASSAAGLDNSKMEMEFAPHHVVLDSSNFENMDEMQKQLEYDKFMNDVWIGVVLTLILISMVFCICSCCLYHQFRTWKRNYHNTVSQSQPLDCEALKLHADIDDPVPEYTLVSGLPSYEAALELLHKSASTSGACLLVYPSVFNVFNKNEKYLTDGNNEVMVAMPVEQQQQQLQQQSIIEVTTPLLALETNNSAGIDASTTQISVSPTPRLIDETVKFSTPVPTYAEVMKAQQAQTTATTVIASDSNTNATTTTTTTMDFGYEKPSKSDKC